MLTEDQVVDAVRSHLEQEGWLIRSFAHAHQHGDDVVAEREGRRLVVEAKGEGSSKEGTRRYGRPFTRNQVGTHVAVATYRALTVVSRGEEAAIALPENDHHLRAVQSTATALNRLGIRVFWVSSVGSVRVGGAAGLGGLKSTADDDGA